MSKLRAVRELAQEIGRAFRGPMPQPAPRPAPLPPTLPRPAPSPPSPRPQPGPQQHRPRPAPGPELEPQPEPAPEPEADLSPDSQAETDRATDAEDEQECANCPDCAARRMGAAVMVPAPQSPRSSKVGYDYQHFVCPWHAYVPAAATIEEWNFSGVRFDGLDAAACHLFEAKHGYDGFLHQDDWGAGGGPELRPWARRAKIDVFDKMVKQARRQHSVVAPHFGEVHLTWVFSHTVTRVFVGALFLEAVEGWYHRMEIR